MEGGEEEPSTLGTVWYFAWEYGGELVPLVGSGRGFKRAYDEGSTLGMAWNGLIFGVEATGVGAALGLIGKGGKAAVATSKVAASGLRPMVSGMASAAKAKAVEAVSVAKSTVSDAVSAVGNKLDGLGERLAGVFGGSKKLAQERGELNSLLSQINKPGQRLSGQLLALVRRKAGFADEGIPLIIDSNSMRRGMAEQLRSRGFNVRTVSEIFGQDPGDPAIKSLAEALGGRVLTNNMRDFGRRVAIQIDPRATTVDSWIRLIERALGQ